MPLAPLVEPGPPLDPAEVRRYSRHVILPDLGMDGQRRLKAARVLVVGAGGLGSPVLMYLAAAGVGTVGVVDDDVVDTSNLQRQVVHGEGDVGRPKVDSAADRVRATNPHVVVERHALRLDADNALGLLGRYDLVVDGTDNFATRYLVSDACEILGLPQVWGSIFRFDGQVSVFWSRPRAAAGEPAPPGVTYRDLHPEPPPPGMVPSCAEGGVLGALCGSVGSVMAVEAVKLVCGIGEPLLGRLLVLDALEATWRQVRLRPDPSRLPVTALIDYPAFCGVPAAAAPADGTIEVEELARLLEARERGEDDFLLVDVREPGEAEIVAIPGSVLVPMGGLRSGEALAGLVELAAGRRLVLHCKSGARSAEALGLVRGAGLADAVHVAGGVLAWADRIDRSVTVY